MAKRVEKTVTTFLGDEDAAEPGSRPFDVEAPDESEVFNELRAKFGEQEIKYKVYRASDKGLSYCFTSVGDMDEDYIQENYGGGKYIVKVLVNNRFAEKHELLIAERMKKGVSEQNPELAPRIDPNNIEARLLREELAFTRNMLLERAKSGTQSPVGEIVDAVKTMHGMNGGGNGGSNLSQFKEMFELAQMMAGMMNGGAPDWKTELLKTAKEVAGPVLADIARKQMAGATAPQQIQGETQMIPPDTMIKQGIEFLKSRAMSGMDPGLAVDWIVNNANDPMYAGFIQQILGQPFEFLVKLDPALSQPPFDTWFRLLYDGLKAAFTMDGVQNNGGQYSAMENDTAGSNGNIGNIADHAGTGKTGGKKSRVS